MARTKLHEQQVAADAECISVWRQCGENYSAASRILGKPRSTIQAIVRREMEREASERDGGIKFPEFPEDDIPPEEILDHLERTFEQESAYQTSLHWFEIGLPTDEPIAINWFGDPHLGSPGCNVPLLRKHVETVIKTPGMYGANIGDTADNWSQRLIKLYAESNTSRKRERALAKWFLKEAGIHWLLWLKGNHDEMDEAFSVYLDTINARQIPLINWRARFCLVFPNQSKVRIDAAHDHKGHSLWNELHAQDRASLVDEHADLYIAGHRHDWATKKKELPTGRIANLARARGYKFIDTHAIRYGFTNKQCGASIVTVFDPEPSCPGNLVRVYEDVDEGARQLTLLRKERRRK